MALLLHTPKETTKEQQVLDLAGKAKILRVYELSEKGNHPEHLRRFINEACWCEWADARNSVIQEKVSRRHLIPVIPISLCATFL